MDSKIRIWSEKWVWVWRKFRIFFKYLFIRAWITHWSIRQFTSLNLYMLIHSFITRSCSNLSLLYLYFVEYIVYLSRHAQCRSCRDSYDFHFVQCIQTLCYHPLRKITSSRLGCKLSTSNHPKSLMVFNWSVQEDIYWWCLYSFRSGSTLIFVKLLWEV